MRAFLCSLHPRQYGHLVITTSDQQFLGLTVAFACVADALNLLYGLYKWFRRVRWPAATQATVAFFENLSR